MVVLEGLRGRPIGELINYHGISQSQYYQWRDRFLGNAYRVFETASLDKRTQRLELENANLKGLVGELTLELKKTDGWP
ncbi:MAG: transposase [Desulfovibrio sp.]|nr:transposase [Desulfovibrio sp.]MBI4958957.1 transposase [Desulfovibrio sp.]